MRRGPRPKPFKRPGRRGWWIRVTEARPDGKRRRVVRYAGTDRDHAQAMADRLTEDDVRKSIGQLRAVTIAEFVENDLEPLLVPRLARKTYEVLESRLLIADEHFDGRTMASITRRDAEDYLAAVGRRVSALTVRHYRANLGVAWKHAVERGAALTNVWAGLAIPKVRERPGRFLSEDELLRVYAAAPADLRPLVVILGESGVRLGEAIRLRWRDVGPRLATLAVQTSTRSTGRVRYLPTTETLRRALRALRPAGVNPEARILALRTPRDELLRSDRERLRAAFTRAGFADLQPKDLRHACLSLLVRGGVPIPSVSRWAGHTTPALVLNRYGHHAPAGELEQARDARERARDTPRPKRGRSAAKGGARRARSGSR